MWKLLNSAKNNAVVNQTYFQTQKTVDKKCPQLGQHFASGGDAVKAFRYYMMKGESAVALFAAAAFHYAHALESAGTATLPADSRAWLERKQADSRRR